MELQGKTVIVTGAGSGIGRAIALEFARQGARLACVGRRLERLEETCALIETDGGEGASFACDVTHPAQTRKLAADVLDRFSAIDVLYNNAGSFAAIGAVWEVDPDTWWTDITVNLRGPMLTCQAVLPHMMERDKGIIVNMNGGGAASPLAGGSGYGCGKAGLLRLTDTLAEELRRVGSKVIVLAMGPGFVRTEMTELQIDSEAGRKWIPSSAQALEDGHDRPPEDCARSSVELLRAACPEMSGRVFGTGEDFAAITAEARRIAADDLRVLRMSRNS